ncbi:alpha-L-fucosidase [Burkholderia glumae]|uniref:alpha-L-fucosidase n=2 Tax=Burkholderia glumae TaxID=337 RepID=A0ABY5B8P6_BURGL|nr:alpha-L-fucosidase [Burkholderia glumae]MCM2483688.1 alpha-L-fucosidase [Burkholderia glumae]MCM2494040.1 alpha-L-fucosidase [Burkholderia glumae]MCM2509390.1 alpha-L-fucosidase [Burkholderia glumae]MCM2544988.1 alpha-L-fucosidase [Burkholderia glumae]MCM2550803.1 alpha-L-fucosidase [Burkholderia glumae]
MNNFKMSRRALLAAGGAVAGMGLVPPLMRRSLAAAVATATANSPQFNLEQFAELRFGMFNHFNMGTFTNEEWATPNQNPMTFAPPSVNCAQWAAAAKSAKMSYGVLTTKHHDGFCLWPSKYNSYNVANSGYRHDIVSQYVTAFREAGLKVGLYFSIWDRTYPVQAYGGHVSDTTQAIQPSNITYILNQIRELLTNYGQIDIWVNDGYAWQMGQQQVPYQQVRELVKSLQPNIIMIDHGALTVPFLGDAIYFEEPMGVTSPANNTYASAQGTTITPAGWFWHPQDPTTDPMSQADIVNHLTTLEPRWTSFLLNCPPNRSGLLDDNIVTRLQEVGAAWSPNSSRPKLPTQPNRCEHPVTPVAAYASAWHSGEGPMRAIDGYSDKDAETCWSTWSSDGSLTLPQSITIDLGGTYSGIGALEYLPKQFNRNNSTDGDITSFRILTSTDGVSFTQVASGNWDADHTMKYVEWPAANAAYVRIEAQAGTGGYCNINNLRVGGRTTKPALVADTTFPVANKQYRIINANSMKALDVGDGQVSNATPVVQNPVASSPTQYWTFERDVSGYFKIRNVSSNKLLEIGNLSRANNAVAQVWDDATAPQQEWSVTRLSSANFMLLNRLSFLSLNVKDGSPSTGATVNQYEFNQAAQEMWQISAV